MDDDDKVVKVDFTEKRPRQGVTSKTKFLQTKTAGTIAVVLLIAFGLFAHFILFGAPQTPQ
jgi:hypothetical protein